MSPACRERESQARWQHSNDSAFRSSTPTSLAYREPDDQHLWHGSGAAGTRSPRPCRGGTAPCLERAFTRSMPCSSHEHRQPTCGARSRTFRFDRDPSASSRLAPSSSQALHLAAAAKPEAAAGRSLQKSMPPRALRVMRQTLRRSMAVNLSVPLSRAPFLVRTVPFAAPV